jgi:hypothetical protein
MRCSAVGKIKYSMRSCLPIFLFILVLKSSASFKCPPAPASFEEYDINQSKAPTQYSCNEIDQFKLKQSSSLLSCSQTNHSCRWNVVNLGLEKTGTSEIANLLRLLQLKNFTFASPRGAASGLKVLESCACDTRVKYVLTTRNLLDMIVSRMAYHHWTCDDQVVGEALEGVQSSSTSSISARCGGMDPSCCWRKDPIDMIQSWAYCRDAYHLNIVDILMRTGALDRLLILNIALEVLRSPD